MRVSVYGTGYVGLVTGVCLASLGHNVLCIDIDKNKLRLLREGQAPFFEHGLETLLKDQLLQNRIQFNDDYTHAAAFGDIHMIAAGTPSRYDGSADMSYVYSVAESIAHAANKDLIIVNKSTVPIGTGDELSEYFKQIFKQLNKPYQAHVVSNPEFLREGVAINDFLNADRIVVGCENNLSLEILQCLYQALIDEGIPFCSMSRRSAEMTKYVANALLATKISFFNQMSQLAEVVGADINTISEAVGLDKRIGPHYNQAGCGYGGSCFPKDVKALIHTAHQTRVDISLIEAVDKANIKQRNWLNEKINAYFKTLKGVKIGLWGLAFKPNTDDIREASSLVLIDFLLAQGAKVIAFDPIAANKVFALYGEKDNFNMATNALDVLDNVDGLAILTEWDEFKQFDLALLAKKMAERPIFDGRNLYDLNAVKANNLTYYSVGRPVVRSE